MVKNDKFETIELINKYKKLESELSGLVFGATEIRERGDKKFIYVHMRVDGRQVTNYVGEYSDELYNLIVKNSKKAKLIKQEMRELKHQLNELGYTEADISDKVKRNIDFAKRNLALTIHSQAILEGVATTFANTEEIIESGYASGMKTEDIAKIVNMKHAWEFILDENVISSKQDIGLLMQINKLIEEGFYYNAGKIRDVPVRIGGTSWQPDLPIESKISEDLEMILTQKVSSVDKAIQLVLYVMRSQIFLDGNKRTAVIFANHYLISKGLGLIAIPTEKTEEFKSLLVKYYETAKKTEIMKFMRENCYLKI